MEGLDTTEYEGWNRYNRKMRGMKGYNWKMREGMDITEYEGRNRYNMKMREGMDTTGKLWKEWIQQNMREVWI